MSAPLPEYMVSGSSDQIGCGELAHRVLLADWLLLVVTYGGL
jgi:hypothetical protein